MRYRTLDSVRGIAAFVVLLHHCLMTFPGGGENRQLLQSEGLGAPMGWLYGTPLRLAVIGPAAVLLFFVLSGFVLTLNVNSPAKPSYASFAIARVFRIWVPFAVVMLASQLLDLLLRARPVSGVSAWFHWAWSNPPTAANLFRHLAMTGTSIDLDSPMWSLIHEMRISLIFPILVLFTIRFRATAAIGSALLCFASIYVVGEADLAKRMLSWASTATYVYFFVIGILLALHVDRVKQVLGKASLGVLIALWIIALFGIAVAPSDTSWVVSLGNGAVLLFNGLAAGLIIALCIREGRVADFLLRGIPRYLGRISYSLYLTHVVVIVALLHLVGQTVPLQVAVASAIPLAILVADLCQRYVEAPSQRLGKVAAARLRRPRSPVIA